MRNGREGADVLSEMIGVISFPCLPLLMISSARSSSLSDNTYPLKTCDLVLDRDLTWDSLWATEEPIDGCLNCYSNLLGFQQIAWTAHRLNYPSEPGKSIFWLSEGAVEMT